MRGSLALNDGDKHLLRQRVARNGAVAEQHVADAVLVAGRERDLCLRAGPREVDRLDVGAATWGNDVHLGVEQSLQSFLPVDLPDHHRSRGGACDRDGIHGSQDTAGYGREQHVPHLNRASTRRDDLRDGNLDGGAHRTRQCPCNDIRTVTRVTRRRHGHRGGDGDEVLPIDLRHHVEHVTRAREDVRRGSVGDVRCYLELSRSERERVVATDIGDVVPPVELRVQVQHRSLDVEAQNPKLVFAAVLGVDADAIALDGRRAVGEVRVVEPDEIAGRSNREERGVRVLDNVPVETIFHTDSEAKAVGLLNRELRPRCLVRPNHDSPPT